MVAHLPAFLVTEVGTLWSGWFNVGTRCTKAESQPQTGQRIGLHLEFCYAKQTKGPGCLQRPAPPSFRQLQQPITVQPFSLVQPRQIAEWQQREPRPSVESQATMADKI